MSTSWIDDAKKEAVENQKNIIDRRKDRENEFCVLTETITKKIEDFLESVRENKLLVNDATFIKVLIYDLEEEGDFVYEKTAPLVLKHQPGDIVGEVLMKEWKIIFRDKLQNEELKLRLGIRTSRTTPTPFIKVIYNSKVLYPRNMLSLEDIFKTWLVQVFSETE